LSQPQASPSTETAAALSDTDRRQGRRKLGLSPAQLARHSLGAVDARCIVSANMRAAGFVPLVHSPISDPSAPSTPLVAPVPTPKDPPRFPPIVFVDPSHFTTSSMWEYQRNLPYGLVSGSSSTPGIADYTETKVSVVASSTSSDPCGLAGDTSAIKPMGSPQLRPSVSVSQSNSSSSIDSESSSGLFSTLSQSSFGLTSVSSVDSQSLTREIKLSLERSKKSSDAGRASPTGKEKKIAYAVDGYPFPRASSPPREASSRYAVSPQSLQSSAQPIPSPAMSWTTASGSATPMAQTPLTSTPPAPDEPTPVFATARRPKPRPVQKSSEPSRASGVKDKDRHRKRSKEKDQHSSHSFASFTELCSKSSFSWNVDPIFIPPSASVFSYGSGFSSSSGSLLTSSSESSKRQLSATQPRSTFQNDAGAVQAGSFEVDKTEDHVLLQDTTQGNSNELENMEAFAGADAEGKDVAVTKMERNKVVGDSKDEDKRSEKGGHRGRRREKDAEWELKQEKRRERRMLKEKLLEADLNAADGVLNKSPSQTSSGASSLRSESGSDGKKRSSPKSRKGKTRLAKDLHVLSSAYTPIFPPTGLLSGMEHAHSLGDYDPKMARERKREAGEATKDQVLARRERDREHARLTEQWSLAESESEKVSVPIQICIQAHMRSLLSSSRATLVLR
jgi:hypothetical protein